MKISIHMLSLRSKFLSFCKVAEKRLIALLKDNIISHFHWNSFIHVKIWLFQAKNPTLIKVMAVRLSIQRKVFDLYIDTLSTMVFANSLNAPFQPCFFYLELQVASKVCFDSLELFSMHQIKARYGCKRDAVLFAQDGLLEALKVSPHFGIVCLKQFNSMIVSKISATANQYIYQNTNRVNLIVQVNSFDWIYFTHHNKKIMILSALSTLKR